MVGGLLFGGILALRGRVHFAEGCLLCDGIFTSQRAVDAAVTHSLYRGMFTLWRYLHVAAMRLLCSGIIAAAYPFGGSMLI